MKKIVCLLIMILVLSVLPAAGEEISEWSRNGYFEDENGNLLYIARSDTEEYKGWYAGMMLGDNWYGNILPQLGKNLRGDLVPDGEEGEFIVTISEEGDDGLVLTADSGAVYHFRQVEAEEPVIFVTVSTEGMGTYLLAEGSEPSQTESGYSFSQINLAEPAVYTFTAVPYEGCSFIKWTKDGRDYSEEPQITAELSETANYKAFFDWGLSYKEKIDYLVLVNKLNPLPEGWEDALLTVTIMNSLGDEAEVEQNAYFAYVGLKDELAAEGINIDLDSAYRSVAEQQEIMDRFTQEYGADYAAKTVAVPGYSEHHTGLALDLYLNIDGEDVYLNEDMVRYPEIWKKIHEKLAGHGFILRYPEGKEHITGYGYEPWHIRYIADPDIAGEIMEKGLTLEEYLGAVNESDVTVAYGTSEIFSEEALKEAAVQIKCLFASWEGCELHSLRYAGDDSFNEENLKWLNFLGDGKYTQCLEFLSDFHSPVEASGAWGPDLEYKDWQWWLARSEESGWDVVTWGY